jgi:CheY-like chemotaxis protein
MFAPILLISEDESSGRTVETRLVSKGLRVRMASAATEALRILMQFVPEVIVIDLTFPWINGVALLLAIREDPRLSEVPVVITTGPATRCNDLQAYGPVIIVRKQLNGGGVVDAVLRLLVALK